MSKKISEFVQNSALQPTDLFNIVRSSTNYKVPFSEFATALGVTGTITNTAGGTPVLYQPTSTTNVIRSLTSGAGVNASLNSQNGITLKHNFVQEATGRAIATNLTGTAPQFSSMVPGAGMEITEVNGVLTFIATGTALPATKVVTVNQLSDFPTVVGGFIPCEDNTVYLISNNITTSTPFTIGINTTFTGYSVLGPLLTYSGSGTMFTGVDTPCIFLDLHITAPNGKIWDVSDSGIATTRIGVNNVNIDQCDSIGDLDLFACAIDNVICLDVGSMGLVMSGTNWSLMSIADFAIFSTSATFIGIDLGAATSNNIDIINPFIGYVSGGIGIKGAANNANIKADGRGSITGAGFIGAGTPLSGIVIDDDVQWSSQDNQNIPDTLRDSLSYNSAGTTVTIATINVPVKIGGTWVDDNSSHFTVDGSGRVTYIGIENLHSPIDVSVTAAPVSGGATDFLVCLAINGSVVTQASVAGRAASSDIHSLSIPWQYEFSTNDYVEVFLQNDSGTTDFTVSHAILRIN